MTALIIAALALGFLGSFHCVGMCGPIAMALPLSKNSINQKIVGALLYNIGRGVTYSIGGIVFGFLGMGFIAAGYQQLLSIFIGIFLLLMVLLPQKFYGKHKITSIMIKIKSALGKLLLQKNHSSLFLIGVLNGLLPCGLVYVAVAGAVAAGTWWQGGLFMLFFALGTFPAMLSISILANKISLHARNKIKKTIPAMVAIMAVLLVLRGLNLGIPYISPEMNIEDNTQHKCCHK